MRTALAAAVAALALLPSAPAAALSFRDRPPEDEVIYFVLVDRFANGDPSNDRGGIAGDALKHGFDPTRKNFYHGGDLKGLTERLDYLQGLGATAIWLAPIYKNKAVQVRGANASAGFHGYWITDFTDVDPHLGTRADFKRLVEAAHARGLKVYLDIVTNHTADVIRYRECHDPAWPGPKAGDRCPYRSKADYPYVRRGGPDGDPINPGFLGDAVGTAENSAKLTDPAYAYTPYVPADEATVKVPAWLNDVRNYHNRGETTWSGESSLYGDFAGLDDVYTERPEVIAGFIEVYKSWITDFGIDGYRIDTARHVDSRFWQAFAPAMVEHARSRGIPNFHVFGEVYETRPDKLALFTRVDRFPSVLDFAFQAAVQDVLGKGAGTQRLFDLFQSDPIYEGGADAARRLPTFLGNHDMGRFAHLIRAANPGTSADELTRRVALGHALMLFARGAPTIYYGDEQGFTGDGNDNDSRQSLFPSKVASYLDDDLLGTDRTHAVENYDPGHPLYRAIAEAARIRAAHPTLRRGEQRVRLYGDAPGLFVFSRLNPATGEEVLVAVNTATEPLRANAEVEAESLDWTALRGACGPKAAAPASYAVTVPALDYVVCRSSRSAG